MSAADQALFSYGTLQLPEVQRATFGRLLSGTPDVLTGFRRIMIEIDDPDVRDASGIATHPALVADPDAPPIPGQVFDVTNAELAAADVYESANYRRITVTLMSGRSAWVYIRA
ncbi:MULTISPECIES: gamma-glutamylcyclotransferase family protein [unclassified Sphingomonas]|uniref:gamma-glutamylcyclotransferase family protein n=1 Tax=unclassified Sphingomonas TaxID=196159 RepID=UPI00082E4A5F|nr:MULTISPECIES: gamma-glutamylcyclotransferase family protein [unclassified Sphingomonas]